MTNDLGARLRRSQDILEAPVGLDQAVMMSAERGCYYSVNAVGRRIWELLERPRTVDELRDALCAEFEVDAQTCEADIVAFLHDLVDNGLANAVEG
jgi:hypothetical protein